MLEHSYTDAWLLHNSYFLELDSLSLENVRETAGKYIDHSNGPIVIVGDLQRIQKDLQSLGYDIEY